MHAGYIHLYRPLPGARCNISWHCHTFQDLVGFGHNHHDWDVNGFSIIITRDNYIKIAQV